MPRPNIPTTSGTDSATESPRLDHLPPLRQVIADHGISASRGLAQNFLLDTQLAARIARSAGDLTGINVIEIGPGPGGLTRALLARGAPRVIAVERDQRCIDALATLVVAAEERLTVVPGDALETDVTNLVPSPRAVVANLPYNIATALLLQWLQHPNAFAHLTLMFQKEVALRITAGPGSRVYGRLSVMAQWHWRASRIFDVSPRAFVPPPKVTSTLVGLVPRKAPVAAARWPTLERVVAASFGQRRKMLRRSLRSLGVDTDRLLAAARAPATARAEELDVEAFCGLARAYDAVRPANPDT